MAKNIEAETGKSVASWVKLARRVGHERHRDIVTWLESMHGLSHGHANFLALQAIRSGHMAQSGADLLAAQYSGPRKAMRPIYERLISAVKQFGADVEIAPRKEDVSLRRHRQFAVIHPTSKRVDVGLVLPRTPPAGRLESAANFNAMFTHRVRVSTLREVDAELTRWLRAAYDGN